MDQKKINSVIAIGELVVDAFPDKEMLGGAPLNFIIHLKRLKFDGELKLITRVGNDEDGKKFYNLMESRDLNLSGLQIDKDYMTGKVPIKFLNGDKNKPIFEILENRAWDYLDRDDAIKQIYGIKPFCLVYGTLIWRNSVSADVVNTLRKEASFVAYDPNLRYDPYSGRDFTPFKLVEKAIYKANMIKLNIGEFEKFSDYFGINGRNIDDKVFSFINNFNNIDIVIMTDGANGSYAYSGSGDKYYAPNEKIINLNGDTDAVGAGDAFFAGFLKSYFEGNNLKKCLIDGNKSGAFALTYKGGIPPLGV